jgi:hypothetical protein
MEMKPHENESSKETISPICGNPAEEGCIYGADQSAFRWLKGDPSFKKNLKAGIGGGEVVGESPYLKGSIRERNPLQYL